MTDDYRMFEIKERLEDITCQMTHLILDIISISLQSLNQGSCLDDSSKSKTTQNNEVAF